MAITLSRCSPRTPTTPTCTSSTSPDQGTKRAKPTQLAKPHGHLPAHRSGCQAGHAPATNPPRPAAGPAPSPAPAQPATPDSGHRTTHTSSPDHATIALDRCSFEPVDASLTNSHPPSPRATLRVGAPRPAVIHAVD